MLTQTKPRLTASPRLQAALAARLVAKPAKLAKVATVPNNVTTEPAKPATTAKSPDRAKLSNRERKARLAIHLGSILMAELCIVSLRVL